MERKSNRAGRFILCSVVGIGLKSFSIVIPEGRGFPGVGFPWPLSFELWE